MPANKNKTKKVTSLGSKIRALRLGYGFSPRLKAWVRISSVNKIQVGIELIPEDHLLPASPAFGSYYFDIRQENFDRNILPLIPRLKDVIRVKKPLQFVEYIGSEIEHE